ncbi:acyl-ACP desaturase [Streptomyces sp. NPDC055239]
MTIPQVSKNDLAILADLAPVVETNLNRHLGTATDWMPHQYVPWNQGRDFDGPLGGEAWAPEQSQLSRPTRSALVLGLLTEDNLPSYFRQLCERLGDTGPWGEWIHRWTAEEGRHAIVMRDYLHTTRAVDPVTLEHARMDHLATGYQFDNDSVLHTIVYTTLQEWSTRVGHRNAGTASGDPVCEQLMARVALDENLHMIFYRNLLEAALDRYPDATMTAIADNLAGFRLPGHAMDAFAAMTKDVVSAGIYTARIHHDAVVAPFLRHLAVLERTGLGPEGQQAQERAARYLNGLDVMTRRVATTGR